MKIDYINTEDFKVDINPLKNIETRIDEAIETYDGIINVVFVDNEAIQGLNKQNRGKDIPTDVLSFNYMTKEGGQNELVGEVYIAVPYTMKQAEQNNESLEDELNKLFVHGILHIHGYDHIVDEDYIKMREKEMEILERELPLILDE